MNKTQLIQASNRIKEALNKKQLHMALTELASMAAQNSDYKGLDSVKELEANYIRLLTYMADGANDPQRDRLYTELIMRVRTLLDTIVRRRLSIDEPTLYYNTVRALSLRPEVSVASIVNSYIPMGENYMLRLREGAKEGYAPLSQREKRDVEEAEYEIFDLLWTSNPLSEDDSRAVMNLMTAKVPVRVKLLAISAITLGLLECYDTLRFTLLANIYTHYSDQSKDSQESLDCRARSITGLLLALYRYKRRIHPELVENAFESMRELPLWRKELTTAFMELIRTRRTREISDSFSNDIIPEMIKLGGDMMDKMGNPGSIDPLEMAENPEWDELMKDSGLKDRLKELNELHMEGTDVYMAPFSRLKSFPFFHKVSNWFMPFDPSLTEIDDNKKLSGLLAQSPGMCDSDKFSMALQLNIIPESQKELIRVQMQQQMEALSEQMKEIQESRGIRVNINNYVQNLYRFYMLFRRKGEFFNPFGAAINLVGIPILDPDFTEADTLSMVAEFFFTQKCYEDAIAVFRRLELFVEPSASRFQKMGYCAELTGHIDEAIKYYQQAELIDENSVWTLRRLARCLHRAGNLPMALSRMERLEKIIPDDISVAMRMGYMLLESRQPEKARERFFKADYLKENQPDIWRALAWTLLLCRDFENSYAYYTRIVKDNPMAVDYLNLGHVALAQGHVREALNLYSLSADADPDGLESVIRGITKDMNYLSMAGVRTENMHLVIDALRYQREHNL